MDTAIQTQQSDRNMQHDNLRFLHGTATYELHQTRNEIGVYDVKKVLHSPHSPQEIEVSKEKLVLQE